MASASEAKWQISRGTLLERNKYMFNNSLMSDIKFAFLNEQIIPAHKYVLAISSPVFFAMFYGGLAEQGETVDITDCDPDVFLQFPRYLYCEDTNFRDVNNAVEVWHLAEKYDLPLLAKECLNFVEAAVTPLNAFQVIPFARRFSHEGLENVCWEIIDYNAQEIVVHESFLDLKHEYLLSFLQRSSLRVNETSLFKAVDRWAAKRCEESNMTVDGANKRSILGEDLLKLIRFPLMSPREFSELVMSTDILLTTEIIDVFKHFTSVPISGGLKFSSLPSAVLKQNASFSSLALGSSSLHKLPADIETMQKSGVMTFLVRKAIELWGVKLIMKQHQSCYVSLLVFERDKKISQIENKNVSGGIKMPRHGFEGIDVFFNRPIRLSENTCYTIKTQIHQASHCGPRTDFFVWSESLQNHVYKLGHPRSNILKCSGHYTECIPADVPYKGEIMALLYNQDQIGDGRL